MHKSSTLLNSISVHSSKDRLLISQAIMSEVHGKKRKQEDQNETPDNNKKPTLKKNLVSSMDQTTTPSRPPIRVTHLPFASCFALLPEELRRKVHLYVGQSYTIARIPLSEQELEHVFNNLDPKPFDELIDEFCSNNPVSHQYENLPWTKAFPSLAGRIIVRA